MPHKSNSVFFFFFFFFKQANFIGPLQKKELKLWMLPQSRRFYGKMERFSLWPTYIGEKGRAFGKTYGIEARCYWEVPWGTHWEPDGNKLGTLREHVGNKGKKKKEILPPSPPRRPHPKLKRKKYQGNLSAC